MNLEKMLSSILFIGLKAVIIFQLIYEDENSLAVKWRILVGQGSINAQGVVSTKAGFFFNEIMFSLI